MLDTYPLYAVLPASDIDRARAWYQEKLGLRPNRDEPSGVWYELGQGTWLLVYPTPTAGTAQNTQAHFQVKDLDSVMAHLRRRGVTFEEYDFGEMGKTENGVFAMGGYRSAWFKDSEGNTFEVAQVPGG